MKQNYELSGLVRRLGIASLLCVACGPRLIPKDATLDTVKVQVLASTFEGASRFGIVHEFVGVLCKGRDGKRHMCIAETLSESLVPGHPDIQPEPMDPARVDGNYALVLAAMRTTPSAAEVQEYHFQFRTGGVCHLFLALPADDVPGAGARILEMAVLSKTFQPAVIARDDASGRVGCYGAGDVITVSKSRVDATRQLGLHPVETTNAR